MAKGILYLSKTEIDMYLPILAQIIKIPMPPEAVKDLDVISEEKVTAFLKAAFDSSKITSPHSFLILLGDTTLFIREFPKAVPTIPVQPQIVAAPKTTNPSPAPQMKAADLIRQQTFLKEQDIYIQNFIDKVPFENVSSKIITTESSRKVIATNKDLFMVFKRSLTQLGFVVEAVVPAIVFQKVVNVSAGFTPDVAKTFLAQGDFIRQNDLLTEGSALKHTEVDSKTGKEKPTNKRAYLLIGIFVLLMLFMIGFYYYTFLRPKPKPKQAKAPLSKVAAPTPTRIAISDITPAASVSASFFSDLTVVISAPPTATQSSALKSKLTELGVKNISIVPTSTRTPKTLVVFSSDIVSSVREELLSSISQHTTDVTSQESKESTKKIVITLGDN